ncbi:transcriptional regulator, AraC family [Arcobacter venerupis]|uniref:Transcriptional regulator, AraC family n=2 Tax=Arcobacter venerupis TaxID=1054033 RepID=A0AAE7B7M7_9BACT|nr:helix-turn-helix domain-containing protein [Arcobacter venerupis]QKF66809.1 transcriptional regulator, AraC family [Arcobacter venerupis]RWS49805.1 AraC family transcriptional regulator [Arcobacter venerupis]
MTKIQKINYTDLIQISKKISNPFSREIYIGTIKEDLGNGISIWYDMGNGIAVSIRNFIPKKNILLIEQSDVSGAVFIFNLGENLTFSFKNEDTYFFKKNHFLLGLASDKFYSETPLEKGKIYKTLTIGMKEELFLKLAHPIKNIEKLMKKTFKDDYHIIQDKNIDSQQFELLDYFKNDNSYEDILKNIYLESKTTDLIHHTIEKISNNLNNLIFNNLDKNRMSSIERAKEIIMQEYNTNLSIKEIAYKSAINECYLKKDFKEYYGMTILEMLQKRRLEVAKQFLKENLSVKEVALKVGYKHTGHFSKLFFDYFGISPSLYKKQLHNF